MSTTEATSSRTLHLFLTRGVIAMETLHEMIDRSAECSRRPATTPTGAGM
jgi:hypothetical protein